MFLRFVFSLIIISFACTQASATEDWGYSHNFQIQKKVSDRWFIVSRSQFNSRDDMREIFLGMVDIGADYQVYDWLKVGGAYRGAWTFLGREYGYENRPMININASKKFKGYVFNNLSRLEFRQYHFDLEDDIRYRNESRVVLPLELTPLKLKPYIEDEFFYSFNADEINANWLTGGIHYQINENVRVKTGYRWLTQKTGRGWVDRHVLVTGFMFTF